MNKKNKYPLLPKKIGAFPMNELPEDVKLYLNSAMVEKASKSFMPILREVIINATRANILKIPY